MAAETATRTILCPDCGTALDVVDRDGGTVYVETPRGLPDECCQRAATERWSKVGMFHARNGAPAAAPRGTEAP